MKSILNPESLTTFLSKISHQYRYGLGERQGWSEFTFYQKYSELIKKINAVINFKEDEEVETLIKELLPWRKGPYQVGSYHIDSEWDSSIKWERLLPYFKKYISQDSVVADLGCNNGYFIFRLIKEFSPQSVVGFEPLSRNALQYLFLKHAFKKDHSSFTDFNKAIFLLLSYEALRYFPRGFDVILCLGILYHHPDPLGILKLMAESLKFGGQVVIDCQGIPGEKPLALFPHRRYAGKKNFWFLPTTATLTHWMERSGYKDIEVLGEYPLKKCEQRVTSLVSGSSLAEGLTDCESYFREDLSTQTTEGYPAPIRIYVRATVT